MTFFNFFLNFMVPKYQNEIAPIFYYGISTKTNEKDLKHLNYSPLTEKVLTECPCTTGIIYSRFLFSINFLQNIYLKPSQNRNSKAKKTQSKYQIYTCNIQ